jgi:hypothetical protein
MHLSLSGFKAQHADAIARAVRDELRPYGIDDSQVELAGHAEPDVARLLSIEVIIEGAESSPMLIETDSFQASLEGQMDLLRAWLRAGHPARIVSRPAVQYKTGDRVFVPDATEPLVAVRDSTNNRVWLVSESAAQDPSATAVPYLIYPDGSLVKEQQHGLPD